jgi:hypothetical protein
MERLAGRYECLVVVIMATCPSAAVLLFSENRDPTRSVAILGREERIRTEKDGIPIPITILSFSPSRNPDS